MDFIPERLHVYVPQQDNLKAAMTVPHHLFLIKSINLTVFLPTIHTTLFISLCNNKISFRDLTVFSHRYV